MRQLPAQREKLFVAGNSLTDEGLATVLGQLPLPALNQPGADAQVRRNPGDRLPRLTGQNHRLAL